MQIIASGESNERVVVAAVRAMVAIEAQNQTDERDELDAIRGRIISLANRFGITGGYAGDRELTSIAASGSDAGIDGDTECE